MTGLWSQGIYILLGESRNTRGKNCKMVKVLQLLRSILYSRPGIGERSRKLRFGGQGCLTAWNGEYWGLTQEVLGLWRSRYVWRTQPRLTNPGCTEWCYRCHMLCGFGIVVKSQPHQAMGTPYLTTAISNHPIEESMISLPHYLSKKSCQIYFQNILQ